jgi:hypothetical protein
MKSSEIELFSTDAFDFAITEVESSLPWMHVDGTIGLIDGVAVTDATWEVITWTSRVMGDDLTLIEAETQTKAPQRQDTGDQRCGYGAEMRTIRLKFPFHASCHGAQSLRGTVRSKRSPNEAFR